MVHVVPDDGRWYPKGTIVRAVRSPEQLDLIPDPNGDEEVRSCTRDLSIAPGRWLVVETHPRSGYHPQAASSQRRHHGAAATDA